MILSGQREGSGDDPARGSSSSARLGPGEGDDDSGLRRPTPNRPRAKRVWKAYHERQVLLAKDRQRSRAVYGKSGDDHRRLPGVDGRTAGVAAVAAARNQPSAVRFNREGAEFTADSLGANGCFIDVYNRRSHGGHAAEGKRARDREKEEESKPNSPGPRTRTRFLRRGDAAAINSGSGGIRDDDRKGATSGKYRKLKRRPHPSPCIGPGTHSLDYGQVANVYEERLFAESEGAETSVSRYLKDRLVVTALDGGVEGRKLRGAGTAKRREMARTVTKKGISDRVAERVKNASLYGCDDGESMCSVLSFEDLHAKTTQVTDALATVERARESEPVKPSRRPRAAADEGGGGGERIDWREQQRRARAASRSETASVATDTNDTALLVWRRSSGGSVAPTVDGDSVDDTVSNLNSVNHDLHERTTATESLSSSHDLDGLRTEDGISEHAAGGIFPPLNRLRRRGSRRRASSSVTSVTGAKVEAAAFAVTGTANDFADRYEQRSTPAAPSDGASLATVAGAPRSTPSVGSAGGLSETGGRGNSASRWPAERKRPSVGIGVSGSAAEELEGPGIVAEDLSSISTTITVVAAASKGERSSRALESTVDSVVTTAAGNSSALDFTLGSVGSPSEIGTGVAGIGPATESVSKWTGSGGRGRRRPGRPKQRKGEVGLESSDSNDWRRRGAPPLLPSINFGSKKLQFIKRDTRTDLVIEACEWGDLEALKQLLDLGASPLDAHSTTNSAESRCILGEFFLFLLQVGAGLRPRLAANDCLHDQVLHELIRARLEKDPKFLSKKNLRDPDERGFCLLHHAAVFGDVGKAEFLLQRGVDPDVRAGGGQETALIVAARKGGRSEMRVADALLRAGADLSAADSKGMTALHHAADTGRTPMCRYLLLAGAKRSAQDVSGRTPFDLCREAHPRAYEVLRGFAPLLPPPRAILDYMEKVEVRGLGNAASLQQATSSRGCIGSILEGKIRDTFAQRRKRGGWFGRRERQRGIASGALTLDRRSKRR